MVVKIDEELLKYINFNYELLFEIKTKEYMAAYKIQQWWKSILMSPHTKVGKKYINKKYDELFE